VRDAARAHPFELMFAGFRDAQFPAVRSALGETSDIHAFLLSAPALELMRDLRPDSGLGDAVDDFVALVHAAYLFWRDSERTVVFDEAATRRLCNGSPLPVFRAPDATRARYIQIAPRIVWGQLVDDEPFEPLDGWFAIRGVTGLRLIACFGVHEQRPGVSVSVVEGGLPAMIVRTDGRPLFAPTMPGGDAAHLHAVSTPDELLLLGWRAEDSEETTRWP
jgi:hypothetical protein